MPALIFKPGTDRERRFELKLGVNTVGRTRDNDVRLNRADVSRQHAEITVTPRRVLLRDLGSRNSSYVNGERVQVCELTDGDTVKISSVRLSFVNRADAPAVAAAGSDQAQANALAAKIALKGRLREGVTPARQAELAEMVAGEAPRSEQDKASMLLRAPDSCPTDPSLAKLQILLDVANRLSTPTPPTERMGLALDLVMEFLNVDRAAILQIAGGRQAETAAGEPGSGATRRRIQVLAKRVRDRSLDDGPEFFSAQLAVTAIEKSGPGMSVEEPLSADDGNGEVRVDLCTPLRPAAKDAALYIESLAAPGAYSDTDVEFVVSFATQIGSALANARALRAAEAESEPDAAAQLPRLRSVAGGG
jgi:hypothetical protein